MKSVERNGPRGHRTIDEGSMHLGNRAELTPLDSEKGATEGNRGGWGSMDSRGREVTQRVLSILHKSPFRSRRAQL